MPCHPFSLFTSQSGIKRKASAKPTPPPAYTTLDTKPPVLASSQSQPTIFFGRIIHSTSLICLTIHPHAALGIHASGHIAFLDASATSAHDASTKHKGFTSAHLTTLSPLQFLFPGLIDTHMHAPQYPNLALGMEGDLTEWCENYTDPLEASYSDTGKARRVYREMVRRELANGSTTVAYNSSIHPAATEVLADLCVEMGQRAVVGKLCIDRGSTHGNWEVDATTSVRDERRVVGYIKQKDPEGRLVLPCVQPRAGSYASVDLMTGLGTVCRETEGIRVQAHMCETPTEVANMHLVHEGFESYADMYDYYGLMGRQTILAHCIHLSERDMQVMQERGAGVAHNPNSNTCLTDGWCRVRELLDRGIKVGLGTDCSAGYSISVLDAMRQASNVSRNLAIATGEARWKLKFEEVVYLATRGGAEVCGLGEVTGSFEVGKWFDALVVDVGRNDNVNVEGWEGDGLAMVKKWVFMGDDRSIRKVYVGGRLVAGRDLKE